MSERPSCNVEEVAAWFAGRVPDDWFVGPIEVQCDRDEILVVGALAPPVHGPEGETGREVAADARISGFREDTRQARMRIAGAAQQRWQRHVAWGARCGEVRRVFTHTAVPVMTRLRFEERKVLDTLIDAGVARSRSEAMAWCVGQVGTHQAEWIDRLRSAMVEVERIRNEGP